MGATEALSYAFSITGPVFVMMGLGLALRRLRVIDHNFIEISSKLVFTVCLPILLFLSIQNAPIPGRESALILFVGVVCTLLAFVLLSLIARLVVPDARDRGVFVQGSFRSNLGILGLAFAAKAYGEEGLALASIIMAVLTILYNILSVVTLNQSLQQQGNSRVWAAITGIAKNPLIIAIVLSLLLKFLSIRLPEVILDAGAYVASMTLPLALLCIGGTLSLSGLKRSSKVAAWASLFKLIIIPGGTLAVAVALGIQGLGLGVLFLLVAVPTAAASYIMVEAMKGNAELAANIVALSTLLSVFSVSAGLFILKTLELI